MNHKEKLLQVYQQATNAEDIRFHQAQIGGFSGRNIDKQLNCASLA